MPDEYDPYAPRPAGQAKPAATKRGTQTGARAIRAIFATARRGLEDEQQPEDPDPNLPRDGIKPGLWDGYPHDNLPPGCPVHVIGRDIGGTVYCITATGLLRPIEKWDMPSLLDLFAPRINYLFWAWPGWGKKKEWDPDEGAMKDVNRVMRVERDKVAAALINAAAKKPLFDMTDQHRGRGGWVDKTGRFIWHSGSWLWTVDSGRMERSRPAEHDGFLYTRQAATIEPWDEPVSHEESPAQRILEDLRTWSWERPYLDPLLCLGWLATSLMGGALKSRPVIFTAGGAGVGKSTLHDLFRFVLEGAVITFADVTAAGIYQRLKQDVLPVMVDELENKAGSNRATSIIDLARIAYSGAEMGRGGADHEAVGFKLRCSFLFSAINPPPMTDADRSRMAILNLSRLDKSLGAKMPVVKDTDGRMLLRQIMDGWNEFQARLQDWDQVLRAQQLDSRSIDTFGPLLAAAETLVGAQAMEALGLPITDADHLGQVIAEATRPDRSERLDNWHKCLNHLLDCSIEAWRDGVKPTVGGTMEGLASARPYPEGLDLSDGQQRLQLVNMTARKPGDPGLGFCLAVPKDGPQLKRLFADTDWRDSGWWYALKQAPANVVIRSGERRHHNCKINGKAAFCLLIDLAAFADYVERDGTDASD